MTNTSLEQYSLLNTDKNIRFYLTGPQPCPYLPNKIERKVFTTLDDSDSGLLNEALTHAGFRRSQNIAYRPACDMCTECVSMRIDVSAFEFTPNWRRIMAKNSNIICEIAEPIATQERYDLMAQYILNRHDEGGMSDMSEADFAAMIEDNAPNTKIIDFRLSENCQLGDKGELIACLIIDELSDGNSMIYSFYNPNFPKQSLGSYIILAQIEHMTLQNKQYLYLGYWIKNSKKMHYKGRFKPFQVLANGGWEDYKG